MSNKIPTIGKVWLILMLAIQGIGAVIALVAGFVSPLFFIAAALEISAVVALVFLLLGKGLPFYILYCVSYGVGSIISQIANPKQELTPAFMIGFAIGLAINFALTYLSVKNTLKKDS